MKKIKYMLSLLFVGMLLLPFTILEVSAREITNQEIVYLEDGSYYEITIVEESFVITRVTSTKTGTKTAKYYSPNGAVMWQVSVKGTFTFNGSSSTCTNASVTATSASDSWIISSKKASKSGNKATGTATAKYVMDGITINLTTKSVTLTCSASGVLS